MRTPREGQPPGRRPGRRGAARKPAGPVLAPALTEDEVRAAYRWILGRAPESEAVVRKFVESGRTPAVLRAAMLASPEFREVALRGRAAAMPLDAPPPAVSLDADADQLALMLRREQRHWARIGTVSPLATPEEPAAPAAGAMASFLASGLEDRATVEAALARIGVDRDRLGRALDLGCGAGRATLHLAAICPEVTGVDLSGPHLAAAAAAARECGLPHIRWLRAGPGRLVPGGPCDLLFSRWALQHDPPPLARAVLAEAFAAVAPGGVAMVQLLTWAEGYGFATRDYLAGARPPRADWHVLPMAEVLALAAASGLVAAEVLDDPVPGLDRARFASHLFVLRRPG